MRQEYQFILKLLGNHVHGEESVEWEDDLDWEQVLTIVDKQGIGGIIWYQYKDHLKSEDKAQKKLNQAFLSDVFYHVCRRQDMKEITEVFTELGVSFIPFKGNVVEHWYPVPHLRTMGDIDMVIRTEDRKIVDDKMLAMGFSKKVDNHAVWTYSRDVVYYEIHDHMMYEVLANDVDYKGYFDQIWDHARKEAETSRYALEDEFHFLYLMAHTAKHFVNKGSGIRPFLDMVFMVQRRGGQMDWQKVERELEHLKLLDFTKTCFALCEKWFDVKMPISGLGMDEVFFEEATEKVLNDGIFGLDNEDNTVGVSAKLVKKSKMPYWVTAIGITLRKLFPSYRNMQLIPWYSFVDGRPYLLPFAWIYRFFYVLKHKFVYGKSVLEEPFLKRKEIEEREELIRGWGL